MACADRWIDVFVTKPDTGIDKQPYEFDDQFACSVHSVEIDPTDRTKAVLVNKLTDWIMPAWTKSYASATYADGRGTDYGPHNHDVFKDIEVGDLVRIGNVASNGHTDYLTVLEIIQIDKLYNGTPGVVPLENNGTDTLAEDGNHSIGKLGIAHYALRLNLSLNATDMPSYAAKDSVATAKRDAEGHPSETNRLTIATRNQGTQPIKILKRDDEKNYYPMYTTKRWLAGSTLRAALDHGVKEVRAIQLVGYSVANKRQVAVASGHEMQNDDYEILRIGEIPGHVISNNRFANGAFAVLYVGSTHDNQVGAIEYSKFEPTGILTQRVDASTSVIRNLTVDITDRLGQPAHFGRMHLWFKLLVAHG